MQKPSTKIKRKVSKTTGIPTTSSGRKRKAQKAAAGGGCLIPIIGLIAVVSMTAIVGCSAGSSSSNQTESTAATTVKATEKPTEASTTAAPTTKKPTEPPTEKKTEKPTEPPTEKQTEKPTDGISREYSNALKQAESYLKHSAFSKDGLYEQLIFEKYSEDAAMYAVDKVY